MAHNGSRTSSTPLFFCIETSIDIQSKVEHNQQILSLSTRLAPVVSTVAARVGGGLSLMINETSADNDKRARTKPRTGQGAHFVYSVA